jgi:protein-disulfide isomerase
MRAMVIALALATPVVAAPAPRRAAVAPNWVATVSVTPQGGYRMGNPAAATKLVEYGSLTCPHCRAFHAEATAELRAMVATGKLSFEFRPYVLNPADFVATTLVRCASPRVAVARIDSFFARQEEWASPFFELSEDAQTQVAAAPDAGRVLALAKAAGLDRFVAAHGVPEAELAQCLTNRALIDQVEKQQEAAAATGVNSTPTFFVNGARESAATWALLEPKLRAATR